MSARYKHLRLEEMEKQLQEMHAEALMLSQLLLAFPLPHPMGEMANNDLFYVNVARLKLMEEINALLEPLDQATATALH